MKSKRKEDDDLSDLDELQPLTSESFKRAAEELSKTQWFVDETPLEHYVGGDASRDDPDDENIGDWSSRGKPAKPPVRRGAA